MKLVINKCYGGFSLSPKAVQRLAELRGKPCYFFVGGIGPHPYKRVLVDEVTGLSWSAFTTPTAPETLGGVDWMNATEAERAASNAAYEAVHLSQRPDNRADPLLVQVVEELGAEASGSLAELKVVEIPDGVDYEIDEYDGIESVHEKHRTWA